MHIRKTQKGSVMVLLQREVWLLAILHQKSRLHTLFASGPPTLPNGAQANGAMGAPRPLRPFANGGVGPGLIPPLRPQPPQGMGFPPMQIARSASTTGSTNDASTANAAVQTCSPEHATTPYTGRSCSSTVSSTSYGDGKPTTDVAPTASLSNEAS